METAQHAIRRRKLDIRVRCRRTIIFRARPRVRCALPLLSHGDSHRGGAYAIRRQWTVCDRCTRPEPDATRARENIILLFDDMLGKERPAIYFYSPTDDRSILLPMLSFALQKRRNLFPLCRRSTRSLCVGIWLYAVVTAIAETFQEITHFFI